MKMEEGFVLKVKNGKAKVRVGRHEECAGCGACGAVRQAVVDAVNAVGARRGDFVRFEVPETSPVLGSLVVFGVPLVLALVLGGAGLLLGGGIEAAEGQVFGLAGVAFGLAIARQIVRWFDRRAAAQVPQIVEVVRRRGQKE